MTPENGLHRQEIPMNATKIVTDDEGIGGLCPKHVNEIYPQSGRKE